MVDGPLDTTCCPRAFMICGDVTCDHPVLTSGKWKVRRAGRLNLVQQVTAPGIPDLCIDEIPIFHIHVHHIPYVRCRNCHWLAIRRGRNGWISTEIMRSTTTSRLRSPTPPSIPLLVHVWKEISWNIPRSWDFQFSSPSTWTMWSAVSTRQIH